MDNMDMLAVVISLFALLVSAKDLILAWWFKGRLEKTLKENQWAFFNRDTYHVLYKRPALQIGPKGETDGEYGELRVLDPTEFTLAERDMYQLHTLMDWPFTVLSHETFLTLLRGYIAGLANCPLCPPYNDFRFIEGVACRIRQHNMRGMREDHARKNQEELREFGKRCMVSPKKEREQK